MIALSLNHNKCLVFQLNRFKYALNLINRSVSTETARRVEKHLKTPFDKNLSSNKYESFWYAIWEKEKLFSIDEHATISNGTSNFSMILPPPNITGDLHMGHALTIAVEDAIFRYQKLKNPNLNAIFVPGYDHAGIGMISVLDKISQVKFNKRINEFSKEELEELVNKWKMKRIHSIRKQLKKMGASLDFTKEKYTMSKEMLVSVPEAFIRLFDQGLIYRDIGIVNWCYDLNSTISDIEIDWIKVNKKRRHRFANGDKMDIGVMYNIALKLENSDEEIIIATTRPYTMPGDVAVAFNYLDPRYQHLFGKRAINPLTGRLMPLVGDHRVSEEMGTGLMKITPACSSIDFEIAQRHKLDIIEIFDSKGNLKTDCLYEEFNYLNGLNRFKLNDNVIEILRTMNRLKSETDHQTRIPVCSKSGDLIEYRILPQWYMHVKKANEFIKQKLENDEIQLIPSNHKNTLLDWIKYDKPWCISRQIKWGHSIPMYKFSLSNGEEKWIAAHSLNEAKGEFNKKCKDSKLSIINIEQEQDVLETWFSSSLVPFCYFGWPNQSEQLNNFYPLSLMETGYDILKFWVHRMLISSYYLTGQLPFKTVLLHGMIVDKNGKKMSKSLGNVIDPLNFMEGISLKKLQVKLEKSFEEGYLTKQQLDYALKNQKELFSSGLPSNSADGLRLCLYQFDPKYEVHRLDHKIIKTNRNLINKIWQSFNFFISIKQNFETVEKINLEQVPRFECIEKQSLHEIDRWILSCLYKFVRQSKIDYENYALHEVYKNFIEFFLHSYCDVYIELIKSSIYEPSKDPIKLIRFSILKFCLSTTFSTMHCLLPFITEELYQKLKFLDSTIYQQPYKYKSIYQSSYPNEKILKQYDNSDLEMKINTMRDCAKKVRSINSMIKANNFEKYSINFKIQSTDDVIVDFLKSLLIEIKLLGRNQNIEIDFNSSFLFDDNSSTELIVDENLVFKVSDHIQIVVSSSEYDIIKMLKTKEKSISSL